MSSDKLARVDLQPTSLEQAKQVAALLAQSAMVPKHVRSPADMLMVLMAGAEMGLGVVQAMRSLYLVDGKVTMAADAILAHLIRGGIRHKWIESTDKQAVLELRREGFDTHTEVFTIDDAKTAGLTGKDNWKKYPKLMLRARCIAAAARAYAPDLAHGIYERDELPPAEDLGPATPSSMRGDAEVIVQSDHAARLKAEAKALRDAWEAAGDLAGLESTWDRERCEAWIREHGHEYRHMAAVHQDYVWRRLLKAARRHGWDREYLIALTRGEVLDGDAERDPLQDEYAPMFAQLEYNTKSRDELQRWTADYAEDLRALEGAPRKEAWDRILVVARKLRVSDADVRAWLAPPAKAPLDYVREARDAEDLVIRVRANAAWIDAHAAEAWTTIVGVAAVHNVGIDVLEEAVAMALEGPL